MERQMITDERKDELLDNWDAETNEEDTQEWRDELTPEEAKLVAEWDDSFAQGFEKIVSQINAKSSLPEQAAYAAITLRCYPLSMGGSIYHSEEDNLGAGKVEKQGTNGMFTQTDQEIDLRDVAKIVSEHDGAVWSTTLSLRREDAEKLGYENAEAWQNMVRGQADNLAEAMGIPSDDLRWFAAFHNESSDPHVHIISYSVGKEPYMTDQGLSKFKEDVAHEIFSDDLAEQEIDMGSEEEPLAEDYTPVMQM